MWRHGLVLAALGCLCALSSSADAQAVAFAPTVSAFPNGVTLNVTPVVSADRRYVRMTVNPLFTGLLGFDTIAVPAAVSGGGIGVGGGGLGGGLGGLGLGGGLGGGAAGGGGGLGGGFRSVAVPGGSFVAGMDGVVTSDQAYALYGQGPSSPQHYSPDASAMLTGANGYGTSSQLRATPGSSNAPRPKATKRPTKSTKSKRPAPKRR
jgi:hypothetical protein